MANGNGIVRVGPVHFQPLEWELDALSPYFSGTVLNAGCGNRSLDAFLRARGAVDIVNYDIASALPGAVIGHLEAMPFPDGRFDTVFSNAVLEHVEHDTPVLREMIRVLRPGGHLVLAVPFLQPFHANPGDYRRYTRDGLAGLGTAAGLELVALYPVHSAAQTLGWIAWEIVKEKKSIVLGALFWPLIFLATRLSLRTDMGLQKNANTYQAVLRRPAV